MSTSIREVVGRARAGQPRPRRRRASSCCASCSPRLPSDGAPSRPRVARRRSPPSTRDWRAALPRGGRRRRARRCTPRRSPTRSAAALPADALVTYDGAHTSFFSNDFTPATAPRTRFHEPGMGHLGFGIPYANALKARVPGPAGGQHHRRRRLRLHAAGAGHRAPLRARTPSTSSTTTRPGASSGSASRAPASSSAPTSPAPTTSRSPARSAATPSASRRAREIAPALERALAAGRPAVIDVTTRLVPHPGLPRFGAAGR